MSKLREEYHNETGLSPVRFIQQYGGQATFEDGFTEHYGEWLEQKLSKSEDKEILEHDIQALDIDGNDFLHTIKVVTDSPHSEFKVTVKTK